jgi:hypothetical protein
MSFECISVSCDSQRLLKLFVQFVMSQIKGTAIHRSTLLVRGIVEHVTHGSKEPVFSYRWMDGGDDDGDDGGSDDSVCVL